MRINARLDENLAYKLDYLVHAKSMNVSDIVKESINRYYDETRAPPPAREILERNGFIGCADSDDGLSVNYKRILTEMLQAKHGDR